ncbi:MAG: hypothetical protein JKY37_08285 [Nannocystaceae bacterium]|nr:hypothetical protein [Nannocystaceae bacterium]
MSSLRGYAVGVAVVIGSLAGACAESESSGISTARSDMTPLVDAACGWMFGCCTSDELAYQVGTFTGDADNCSERLLDAIEAGVPLGLEQTGLSSDPAEGLLVLALSINQGRVNVNSGAVQACADATETRECNVVAPAPDPTATRCTPGEQDVVEVTCDPDEMFVGNQNVGEECAGQFECKPPLRCIALGTAGVCARAGEIEDNCFADAECATGLICSYGNGTCSEGKKLGEACAFVDMLTPTPGTESIRCAEGLSCDPTTSLCVGGFCAPGAPCNDTASDTDCPEGFFCAGDGMGFAFSCQAPSGPGTPCSRNETCASAYCDINTATCGTLIPDGSGCAFNEECASGFCDGTATCAPTGGNGDPCMSNEGCAAGYCDFANGQICASYASEGGPCPNGIECDPTSDLFCVDLTCQRTPFPNGVACGDGSQCQTGVCFNAVCADGTSIGGACSNDGMLAACVLGSFCDLVVGADNGTCVQLLRSGQACLRTEQCWGDCVVRYGSLICDATPAFDLAEAWCDGPS